MKYWQEHPNIRDIHKIFLSTNHESADLIWNSELRSHLREKLFEYISPYIAQLDAFATLKDEKQGYRNLENMPMFGKPFPNVIKYPSLVHQPRIGEFYLTLWMKNPNIVSGKQRQDYFIDSIQTALSEINQNSANIRTKIPDANILLEAAKLAIKT